MGYFNLKHRTIKVKQCGKLQHPSGMIRNVNELELKVNNSIIKEDKAIRNLFVEHFGNTPHLKIKMHFNNYLSSL